MKSFKLLFVGTMLALMSLTLNAQTTTTTTNPMPRAGDYNTWSIGINAGPAFLYGTMTTEAYYKDRSVNNNGFLYGATLKKSFSHLLGLEGQFLMGDIKAKNVQGTYFDGQNRYDNVLLNASLDSKVKYDLTLNSVFTLGNFSWLTRKANRFHLTASVGVGYISFTPDYTSDWNPKTSSADTGKSFTKKGLTTTQELILPFGLGVVFNASKSINIILKYRYTVTNGSKLDYTWDPAIAHEAYGYASLGLIYVFGKKEKFIDWVNPTGEIYNQLSDVKKKIDGLAQTVNSQLANMQNTLDSAGKVTDKKLDDFGKKIDGLNSDFTNLKTSVSGPSTSGGGTGTLPSIFFQLDGFVIQYTEYEKLATVAIALKEDSKLKLKIVGNCDQSSTDQYNLALGDRRAQAAKDHLVKVYGIDASRLTTESNGKKDPLAKDIDSINRRVDFKVTSK